MFLKSTQNHGSDADPLFKGLPIFFLMTEANHGSAASVFTDQICSTVRFDSTAAYSKISPNFYLMDYGTGLVPRVAGRVSKSYFGGMTPTKFVPVPIYDFRLYLYLQEMALSTVQHWSQ